MLTILLAVIFGAAPNYPLVSAQSCSASIGYSSLITAQYYYGSNIGILVPVSASCPYASGQLYATGDAFDTYANIDYGSVSTIMYAAYGSSAFNGQLAFNLPPSIIGHQLRIVVSVYAGQNSYGYANGPLLATAGQMLQVNLTYQNNYPYGNGYCNSNYNNCYGNYGNCYQTYSCYPNMNYCNYYQPYCYGYSNCNSYYRYHNYYYGTSCNDHPNINHH